MALACCLIGGVITMKAESTPPTKSASGTASAVQAAKKDSSAADVSQFRKDFQEKSKDLLEQRRIMKERLDKATTEEEKERIRDEMRQQQQQRMDQQRELARQIREQMQQTREDRLRPGG